MLDSFFKQNTYGCFIDGEFVIDEKTLSPHYSITLGKQWKEISLAEQPSIDQAIDSAEKGLAVLRNLSSYKRAEYLQLMAELMQKWRHQIATLISMEMGKPIKEAEDEVDYAKGYFLWFAEEAKRIYGYTIPSTNNDKELKVIYQPIGISAIITPWNFPIAMGARKIAPALAAGCPVIVRPSSDTPLSMLAIAAIAKEACLPKEALQVLMGNAELISKKILKDPRVRKLTFTGSTQTGEILYRQCVSTFKKVTLELGGHAPFLVFDDADIDRAVEEAIHAKLRISGQTCVCANRLIVQETILPTFVQKLKEKVLKLHIGSPLDPSTDLSNVLHPTSMEKVQRHIKDAKKQGAYCVLEGKQPYEPTILLGIKKEMLLFQEETFGPVIGVIGFTEEKEAIHIANDTIYGLASYLFTRDLNRAHRICDALQYAMIGLNDGLFSTPQIPFGGMKYSGFGREGGPTGIYEYLQEKTISLKF